MPESDVIAGFEPEKRSHAKIVQQEAKAETEQFRAHDLKDKLPGLATDSEKAWGVFSQTSDAASQEQIKKNDLAERNLQTRSRFFGLGRFFGERERNAQEKEQELLYKKAGDTVNQAKNDYNEAVRKFSGTKHKFKEARRGMHRAFELSEAERRNLGVKDFLGAPSASSEGMTEALRTQDETARTAKFYAEARFDIDSEHRLKTQERQIVIDTYNQVNPDRTNETITGEKNLRTSEKRLLDGYGSQEDVNWHKGKLEQIKRMARADNQEAVVTVTGFLAAAKEYAKEKGISINQEALLEAARRGMVNEEFINSQNRQGKLWQQFEAFQAQKLEVNTEELSNKYPHLDLQREYLSAAFRLHDLAEKFGIPEDESMVPYVHAFLGGRVAEDNNAVQGLLVTERDLIYDLIPHNKLNVYIDEPDKTPPRSVIIDEFTTLPRESGLGRGIKPMEYLGTDGREQAKIEKYPGQADTEAGYVTDLLSYNHKNRFVMGTNKGLDTQRTMPAKSIKDALNGSFQILARLSGMTQNAKCIRDPHAISEQEDYRTDDRRIQPLYEVWKFYQNII